MRNVWNGERASAGVRAPDRRSRPALAVLKASLSLLAICLGLLPAWQARAQRPDDASRGRRPRVTELGPREASEIRLAQQPEQVAPFRAAQPDVAAQPADRATDRAPEETLPPPPVRQPRLFSPPDLPEGLAGPQEDPAVAERYRQYVERTIDPEATLDLVEGRPRILVFRAPPLRVQIADENVASYLLITENELSVVGVKPGSTVLNLWFDDPQQGQTVLSYLVRVYQDPASRLELDKVYEALEDEINRAFPDSRVELTLVGDKLVVRGQAHDVFEAAQILRLAEANAPDAGRGVPVEQINFNQQTSPLYPYPGSFGVADTIVEPIPPQDLTYDAVRSVFDELSPNVVNLLHIPGEQQVMLRVTVAEVNRSAARSIGLNFSILNDDGLAVFSNLTGGLITDVATGGGGTAASVGGNLPTFLDNGQVALAIEALRTLNFARSLAEPNLVTLNGQPARFRAGGQFPVPAASLAFGGVGQGVAFIPFGVQLQFVPYITDRDRVRLQVAAAVSTRDESLGANVGGSEDAGGTQVSGLQARTFQTTVELREGQTLAVAGLIQTNFGASSTRVPFWGDLPLIGHTGGRRSTSADEQELVILITPELVHPLEACQTPLLPGADLFEPGDLEFFLLGRLESRRSEDFRSPVRTDCDRMERYKRCEDLFIIGRQGHSCCGADGCGDCR